MAWQYLIPAAIQATGTLLQRNQKVRRPGEELSYWKQMSKQGIYSPQAKSSMLGTAGREMGNVAQRTTADTRGMLESRGMGRSVAGIRALNEPRMNLMRNLGDFSRNIDAQNEMSKVEGAGQYAGLLDRYNQAKQDVSTQNWNQKVGGLMNAGMMGAQVYAASKEPQFSFPENFGAMSEQDAYTWATQNGYDWNQIQPIWMRMQDDTIMGQLTSSGQGSLLNPVRPAMGWR